MQNLHTLEPINKTRMKLKLQRTGKGKATVTSVSVNDELSIAEFKKLIQKNSKEKPANLN